MDSRHQFELEEEVMRESSRTHRYQARMLRAEKERDSLRARVEALEAENEKLRDYRDRIGEQLLEWRGIDQLDACKTCGGSGVRSYLNTTTWMGEIGGQMITNDVCDKCWGSGSASRPGYDLRKAMRRDAENERLRRAVEIVREKGTDTVLSLSLPSTGPQRGCWACMTTSGHREGCWLARALRVAEGEGE